MTDNEIIALLAGQIDAALTSGGYSFPVIQKDQPTQQGVPGSGAVFFQKLFDHPYGSPIIEKTMNVADKNFAEVDSQWYETTFQVSALVTQDPTNLSLPTAADVANYVKMYLASRVARAAFNASGAGTLRVLEVRQQPFQDDRERFEYHPNFDIVLNHVKQINIIIPGTNDVRPANGIGVYPVLDYMRPVPPPNPQPILGQNFVLGTSILGVVA